MCKHTHTHTHQSDVYGYTVHTQTNRECNSGVTLLQTHTDQPGYLDTVTQSALVFSYEDTGATYEPMSYIATSSASFGYNQSYVSAFRVDSFSAQVVGFYVSCSAGHFIMQDDGIPIAAFDTVVYDPCWCWVNAVILLDV